MPEVPSKPTGRPRRVGSGRGDRRRARSKRPHAPRDVGGVVPEVERDPHAPGAARRGESGRPEGLEVFAVRIRPGDDRLVLWLPIQGLAEPIAETYRVLPYLVEVERREERERRMRADERLPGR